MREFADKRQFIERGLLATWSRRGRGSSRGENHRFLCALLRVGLRLTGLRRRGELNALHPVIRELRLTCNNLPQSFCGLKILHLTDFHVDGLEGLAEAIGQRLSGLYVDLCVLTGDYRFKVTGPCHDIYAPMQTVLSSIQARLGIVGVLGNHDVSEEVTLLEHLGVRMLVNEALELQCGPNSIWLVGLDDPHYYGCDDLPAALREVPPEACKILLVHTPEIVEEAAASGIDLYLCGHTHGGQICLPGIGPLVTNASCARAHVRGLWKYKHMQGYTNAGVGTSGVPVRFFCPPEIGLIELRCGHHRQHATDSEPRCFRQDGREMPASGGRPSAHRAQVAGLTLAAASAACGH